MRLRYKPAYVSVRCGALSESSVILKKLAQRSVFAWDLRFDCTVVETLQSLLWKLLGEAQLFRGFCTSILTVTPTPRDNLSPKFLKSE